MLKKQRKLNLVIWPVSGKSYYLKSALRILGCEYTRLNIIVAYKKEIKVAYNGELLPYVNETQISGLDFDLVLAAGTECMHNAQIIQRSRELGIKSVKLLLDKVVCTPGFTLEKYRLLQETNLSIFAAHCFGGILAYRLGLPFNSPFINMFFSNTEGYLLFLSSPREYMAETPVFLRLEFERNLKRDYPVVRLGDIEIHWNHYTDFEAALRKWEDRKKRINWDNLFVTMYADKVEDAISFSELPYNKKACFTSFETDIESAYYLPDKQDRQAWERSNAMAFGRRHDYDVFEMLLNGRKIHLDK